MLAKVADHTMAKDDSFNNGFGFITIIETSDGDGFI